MNQEWVIELPISIPISAKHKFSLNLNIYRNANFRILAAAKIAFAKKVTPLVRHLPKMKTIALGYCLYPGSNHLTDISNVCCIVDKFFSDVLVSAGCIEDDNYKFVKEVNFMMGHVDKTNPRVEVTIHYLT